jgi:hypothetical protein
MSSRRSHTVSTVKQVARDDPGSLLAQERPPGGVRASWWRVEPVAAKRRTDRGHRDPHAEAEELTLDALVAHRGFWLARRTISCWISRSSSGRPVWRCG